MTTKPPSKSGPKGIPAPKPNVDALPAVAPVEDAPRGEKAKDRSGALKLRDLVDRVVTTTGGKKKGVKEIVEATLNALGSALAKGEELNLPGVGKVRVAKSVDKDGRAMMTLKVRGMAASKPKAAKEALAEADEAV
jgi:DNA-binding protein HU-alpha